MQTASSDALREALQLLIRADIADEPKRLLIAAVMQTLTVAQHAEQSHAGSAKAYSPWQPDETEMVAAYLHNKTAVSWQHADEITMHLVHALHRHVDDVRSKAVELGLGKAVDYRLAKLHADAAAI